MAFRPAISARKKTLFYEAVREEERIGVGALQFEGSAGLLRSVAISKKYRGMDYGTRLVETLVNEAREQNLDGVYLLTTGGAPFFRQLGFEDISREDLPESI